MKKIKVRFTISLLLMVALSMVGCSSTSTELEGVTHKWNLAVDASEDTVTYSYAKKFADEVYERSNGEMHIQIYANGTLGGDRELLESCMGGNVDFIVQTTAPQVSFMPELAVFDLPVPFKTIDEVRNALDNEDFMNTINAVYDEAGYHLMGYADQSFRVLSTNVAVDEIEDLKGQKIRTMENSNHIDFWKALDANPTPMAFAEVYIGLQQGTIDAQENPYEIIVANKFYEQQDYVVQTNHLPHILALVTNNELFDSLTDEEAQVLVESVKVAKEYAREQADTRVEERLEAIKDSGTEIIEISDELYGEIRDKAQPVYDSITEEVGEDLVNAYLGE